MNVLEAQNQLLDIKRVLDNQNVPFWLNGGTLLGAIRDKALFNWDHDLDILIRSTDYSEELLEHFKPHFPTVFPIKHMLNRVTCFDLRRTPSVRTNVILMYKNEDKGVYIKFNPPLVNNCKTLIPIEMIDAENYIEFLGEQFRIPHKAELLLESHYGDWRTPIKSGLGWRNHWEPVMLSDYSEGIL